MKNGNVICTRSDELYLVNNDTYISLKGTNAMRPEEGTYIRKPWKDDYTHVRSSEHDIIKIYEDYTLSKVIWERKDPILTDKEKAYLSAVIAPFKDKISYIQKWSLTPDPISSIILEYRRNPVEYIKLFFSDDDTAVLPTFPVGKYYTQMERFKRYTLEELGL